MTPRSIPRALTLVICVLALLAPTAAIASPMRAGAVPDESTWTQDVRTAMKGARGYLRERVANSDGTERLAINLDIDNTSLATFYDSGRPVRKVRNFARLADRLGVTVLFNTGRMRSRLGPVPRQLRRVGFDVERICTRKPGELLPSGKQRCRDSFAAAGYTLIANVGNNDTDFAGDGYERAFRLPNYDGALG